MQKSFYSHGKLLLTAEYLVLDGTNALAIPTKKGQWLLIEKNDLDTINWKSYDEQGNCWFKTNFILEDGILKQAQDHDNNALSSPGITETLVSILNAAKELNPNFLADQKGYNIETRLEFHREWGLGSSSTLINNIAQWAKVNPFTLLENSFGGSGYDIACAKHDTPILFTRSGDQPIIKEVSFDPPFKKNIFFIYLNQKQDSKASIKHYQSLPLKEYDKAEATANEITQSVLNCETLDEFEKLINQHEEIISKIIKTPTVKSILFSDYSGSIKSLGGWGGDFVLATGSLSDMEYFRKKGYDTIIPYNEMALS
ncbi:GYDIA family GHMP kinase [Aquimarina sp. MMG016]|uniref:GYDIA family GHMP kinase n=1 Tax=Aquimarina sp. MMG016 TaxID=2822690 RepID=UPI001B3A1949|nr:GYDIA family GHMP kinase [Aquimarina sp. MMG016]MBQ4818805.1 GHMP kinase [Aquimarina sp. MMG016]